MARGSRDALGPLRSMPLMVTNLRDRLLQADE